MTNSFNDIVRSSDFVDIGLPLFESEELTESLISIYLSVLVDGWIGATPNCPLPIENIGRFYSDGLWLSCVPRVAISAQIDRRNDGLVDVGSIPVRRPDGFDFVTAQRIRRLPRGFSAPPFASAFYWAAHTSGTKNDRRERRLGLKPLIFDGWYFALLGDRIVPTKSDNWPNGTPAGELAREVGAALQTAADLRKMWVVTTQEETVAHIRTPLRLGVDGEIIKSLFYARELPVSETGRRRPILHWVNAHKRRLRSGTDIKIDQFLRGITKFEMDGFSFEITQPLKKEAA